MNVYEFIELYKTTSAWNLMATTVEDSPWHREANVAVHTEMCIEQYIARFVNGPREDRRTEREVKLGLLALLFHDVGKPDAEETLDKKDGSGTYRRYAGHEPGSAIAFTECYLTTPELQQLLTPQEARAVRWTIEHHLPYGMTDKVKRQGLRTATLRVFTDIGLTDDTFFDCLRSDAAGRISDDHETKLANVEAWINEFRAITPLNTMLNGGGRMILLVGPSGSGKTTFINGQDDQNALKISADEMKVEFYKNAMSAAFAADPLACCAMPDGGVELYEAAWKYCTLEADSSKAFEKHFKVESARIVKEAAKRGVNVYVDLTNASRKKRGPFVELAKQNKLDVTAVEFWNTFETLCARQATRGDKCVPPSSINQQLYATALVWLGFEAESVLIGVGS